MFYGLRQVVFRLLRLGVLSCLLPAGQPLSAAPPTGPTLRFDYGAGRHTNSLSEFMYFVPLIAPEQISVFTNAGNTQAACVTSFLCRTNGRAFHAVCQFDFVGDGLLRNVFDLSPLIRHREKDLQAGKVLARQLTAINVLGHGSGTLEVDGLLTNGRPVVVEMRLCFNRGHASPVTVHLQDVILRNGAVRYENEIVARVNALTFQPKTPPRMEVTLGSVNRADAGDSLWQSLVGGLKGAAANLLVPPLPITTNGQQTMMDFALALATEQPVFTFPFAERLKSRQVEEVK